MKAVPASGLDLEMPGPARWMANEVVKKALDNGTLTEDLLNDKVRRLLGVLEKAGSIRESRPFNLNGVRTSLSIARSFVEAAQEAIVLLKNDGTLPLKKVKSIAVIGPYANAVQILGGGSSSVTPHYVVTPFEGIKNRAGKKIKVDYAPGCFIYKNLPAPAPETLSTADGRIGLNLSLFNGTEFSGDPVYSETTTRVQHGWFHTSVPNANQESFSMRMEGFFTPKESGMHTLALSAVGWCKLYLDDKLIIDHSSDSDMGKQLTAELKLKGGKSYPIKVEYYWKGNRAGVQCGHLVTNLRNRKTPSQKPSNSQRKPMSLYWLPA